MSQSTKLHIEFSERVGTFQCWLGNRLVCKLYYLGEFGWHRDKVPTRIPFTVRQGIRDKISQLNSR